MAGNANDITKRPFPFGGLQLIEFPPVDIQASKTDYVYAQIEVPYAFRLKKAEKISEAVAITNGVTLDVIDDTGTPQVLIADEAITAITAGSAVTAACTVDDEGPVYAGAKLSARYTSGASDTSRHTTIRLWVEPLHV